MQYATTLDLLSHVGTSVQALADVTVPDDLSVVSGDLLRATIEGTDRSAFDADEITAADAGLINIQKALNFAGDKMRGRLRSRYPDNTTIVGDASLVDINCNMALYKLWGLRGDEDITKRNTEALKDLNLIATGVIHIGVETASAATAVGHPEVSHPESIFGRDDLKDF